MTVARTFTVAAAIAMGAGACTGLKADEAPDAGDASALPDPSTDAGADAARDADAAHDVVTDVISEPPPCVPLSASPTDIYVDASAAPGGYGSAVCPLTTITAALKLAVHRTTIHVAAGRYDAAHDESFPLVLRGVTVIGDGAGRTIVHGSGPIVTDPQGNLANAWAAIVMGDSTVRTSLTGISVEGEATVTTQHHGVVCDRGNAPTARGATTAPNDFIEAVSFGTFDAAVVAAASDPTVASACNLHVTKSQFTGGASGIWAVPDFYLGLRPAVVVGDGTAQGANVFRHMRYSSGYGATGVRVWDGVTALTVDTNTFTDSDTAIAITEHRDDSPWLNHYVVENNTISAMSVAGLYVAYAAVLDDLSNNTIQGVVSPTSTPAPALMLIGEDSPAPYYPAIRRARGNRIIGNDIGVAFYGSAAIDPGGPAAIWNFGTAADPGKNEIRCNSRASGGGYDVFVSTSANGPVTLSFSGNTWDHAPPSLASSTSAPNGTDAVVVPSNVSFVTSGATQGSTACPQGFVP